MGLAIVSDIHSNLPAFQAVLQDIENYNQKVKIDKIYCLGDIIGYGCQPVQVLNLVSKYINVKNIVVGNHEDLYWGNLCGDINDKAKLMLSYNRYLIDMDNNAKSFLNSLNHSQHYVRASKYNNYRIFITHNGPVRDYLTYRYPWHDQVLLPALYNEFEHEVPQDNRIRLFKSKPSIDLFFFGHTHFPTIAFSQLDGTYTSVKLNGEFSFDEVPGPKKKILINPGSVGYPRDNNPDASYMVIDDSNNKLIHRRVRYRFDSTVYDEAKEWLQANYVDGDQLGKNYIFKLVDDVQVYTQRGTFSSDPQLINYDGWKEFYGF